MSVKEYQGSFEIKDFECLKFSLVVFIFIIILSLIIIFNNNFYDYYNGVAIVEDDNKISTLVNVNDLDKVLNNGKMIIERTTFAYNVLDISNEFIEYGTDLFKKVVISIELDTSLNITNNYINYKIITGKDTIIKYVFKTIKGE